MTAVTARPARVPYFVVVVPSRRIEPLERVLILWISSALLFMLLPGTFLGVWNLIAISGSRAGAAVSDAWIQAHGHAQIFGWIGSFILGVGFCSLSKMGSAASRARLSWRLWTAGVTLRWVGNVYAWHWRVLLPVSSALELAAFCIFFDTVRRHRPEPGGGSSMPLWTGVVIASTIGFLASLVANLGVTIQVAIIGASPAVPHVIDQRLLALFTWGLHRPGDLGLQFALAPGVRRNT